MDFVSVILLGALNTPVLILFCRTIQKKLSKDGDNFWRSLLAWSFDPHAFFDKDSRHNHLAVLFLSISVACCVLLMLLEYELAYRVVESVKGYGPFQTLVKF
jgi:Trk-type K+ transport system membrane component